MNQKRTRRRILTGAATIVAVGAALAFLPRRRRTGTTTKLAFVPKALNNPVFEITRAGAEDRIESLPGVSLRWVGPSTTDAVAQSQIIDDLSVQGIDGIGVNCNDPDALLPAINRAVEDGVAVITWDSDAPRSKRLSTISIDQEAAGNRAGHLMLDRVNSGPIAILTGTPGALNLEQRRRGFTTAIATNPQLRVIATDPCYDDVQRAVEIVEQRITAVPDLTGYFFVGMWPFFADLKTLSQLKSFVSAGGICISLDALEGALNAVDGGYANALVGYSWYDFGRRAVDVLFHYLRGHEKPPDPLFSELFVVDQSNIQEFQLRQRQTGGRF
jgi:ribose transport system substrate-binding protein